jgi:hypothetical protein
MRHFWSRKMVSVNGIKPTRPRRNAKPSNPFAEIARVLQTKPSALSEILSRLHARGKLAASPARQVAQTAIASRCGNNVEEGISFLEALSLPVEPLRLYSPLADAGGARLQGAPNHMLLQGGDGFKSPPSLLTAMPERHSFVDLFEQLLLSSRMPAGGKSVHRSQGVRPGAAVITGHTAQITMRHAGCMEIIKYTAPEEIAGMRKDVAQFTGQTIVLLAGLAKEHLVWRPAIAFTLCG